MSTFLLPRKEALRQPQGILLPRKSSNLLGSKFSIISGSNNYIDVGTGKVFSTNSVTNTIGKYGKEFYGTVGNQISTPSIVDYSSPITLAAVFNGYVNTQANSIYFMGQQWGGGLYAFLQCWDSSIGNFRTFSTAVTDGVYNTLVATIDATKLISFYVNDVLIGSVTAGNLQADSVPESSIIFNTGTVYGRCPIVVKTNKAWDKSQVSKFTSNPWQVFEETSQDIIYINSVTGVDVNLSGTSSTVSGGSFTSPAIGKALSGGFVLPLSGSPIPVGILSTTGTEITSTKGTVSLEGSSTLTSTVGTLGQGSLTKDAIKALLGTSFDSIIGDITPFISEDLNINLSGNQITLSKGDVLANFSKTISGIENTFSFGDILSLLSITPSGISATVVNGVFSVVLDSSITLTLTGQQATLALQALIGTASFDATGNTITSSRGSFIAELSKVLSGQVVNATYGIFTVEGTADRVVFLSGQSLQIVKDSIIPEIRKTPTGNVINVSLQPIIAELNKLLVSNAFSIVGETIVATLDLSLSSISGTLSFTAPFIQGQIVIDARASWKFLVKDNSPSFLIKE